jgi:hypothetical protein
MPQGKKNVGREVESCNAGVACFRGLPGQARLETRNSAAKIWTTPVKLPLTNPRATMFKWNDA